MNENGINMSMLNASQLFEKGSELLETNSAQAIEHIKIAAGQGNEKAMELLADCYYKGNYVDMDEPLAFEWFNKIVNLYPNNGFIHSRIGDCFNHGYGVVVNHVSALSAYQKAWDAGYYEAAADIGWMHSFGEGIESDDRIAAQWYNRAADKNISEGHYYLGWYYDEGYGLPKSKKMAFKHLMAAASQDNVQALRYLLFHNCVDMGDENTLNAILAQCIRIAEDGSTAMQYHLGVAYKFEFGVKRDIQQSMNWLQMAADSGYLDALLELGKELLDRDSEFPRDYEKAKNYLLQAANRGSENACYELYRYYRYPSSFGRGSSSDDIIEAVRWGERAVELGKNFLALDLAQVLSSGKEIPQNLEKAYEFYKIAADNENSGNSYLPLADCYLYGKGTSINYKEASAYLNLAMDYANENDSYATQKGTIEFRIAYMYENGLGYEKNLEEALKHYSKSAEYGYEKAKVEIPHFKKGFLGWKKI